MKRKKLTASEIDQALEKIRRLYDDYMVRFIKSRKAREAFEERYLEALRARIDLDRFLSVEVAIIKQMLLQAEERMHQETARLERISGNGGAGRRGRTDGGKYGEEKKDFADRVIDKIKEKASRYPLVGLECEDLWEVDHLIGGMQKLEREIWPAIDRLYRRIFPNRFDGPRIILENRLLELAESRMGGVPQVLHPLQLLLGRFPRDYREIEWEVKQTILRTSFFLHTLKGELEKLLNESYLSGDDQKVVEVGLTYVKEMIEDFRLKDLKQP
jgi:hypothetical protein